MKDTWETSYILASEDWKVLANEVLSWSNAIEARFCHIMGSRS